MPTYATEKHAFSGESTTELSFAAGAHIEALPSGVSLKENGGWFLSPR